VGGDGGGGDSPIFLLMDVDSPLTNNDRSNMKKKSSSLGNNDATMEMYEDEELPLTVYEPISTTSSMSSLSGSSTSSANNVAFVNVNFDLETYEPERIAVEKVFRTRPTRTTAKTTAVSAAVKGRGGSEKGEWEGSSMIGGGGGDDGSGGGSNRRTGKKCKKDRNEGQKHPPQPHPQQRGFVRGLTVLDEKFESLESSIRAMHLRVSVLCEYLTRVELGEVPVDTVLLRSIDGLVRQLPLVLASLEGSTTSANATGEGGCGRTPLRELEDEYDNAMLLTYLAAVAKTARAVHVYTEKSRCMCDSRKSDPRRPLY